MRGVKPSIFIGSSTEALGVAELVAHELRHKCECKLWTTEFNFGASAYEDLVNHLSLYDYGLLIATADDVTISRHKEKPSPRDNVIFEFGLFAGRLGRQRAFLMVQEGVKLPSDLSGITLPCFSSQRPLKGETTAKADARHSRAVVKCSEKLLAHIKAWENAFTFGFLPSTALAFGYYNNFVYKVVDQLLKLKEIKPMNGGKPIRFRDLRLTCLIPNDLRADMFDQVKAHCLQKNWQLIKIAPPFGDRPFDFFIQMDKCSGKLIALSDIPLTLNALDEAIHAYIGKSYVGVSEAEGLLECRELGNFRRVLDCLTTSNPLTKNRVKIEIVSI